MIGKNICLVKDIPTKRGFSLRDAADYIGVSKSTLRRRTNAGEIPCYDDHGRRIYHLEDLDAYLEKQRDYKSYHKEIPRAPTPDKA